jgi:hypothetical protein
MSTLARCRDFIGQICAMHGTFEGSSSPVAVAHPPAGLARRRAAVATTSEGVSGYGQVWCRTVFMSTMVVGAGSSMGSDGVP